MPNAQTKGIIQEVKTQAVILLGFVGLMWGLEIIDQIFLDNSLNSLGIRPRSISGLWGILFAPFLHGNFAHLIGNTVPFVILGWLVMLREISDFFVVTITALLVGGLGVWLFAAPGPVHIGASGLIFGYLGYLLFRGYFERSAVAVFFSILVGVLYGSLIWGIFPSQFGISWQGHLFGFGGGALAARLLARRS